ncbi:hypothetical protein K443DRAFT_676427 [Laccaria amethystina LaAM-08-1]|uniref:Uncharacterized protein n=1 Tax=Laccaria amethystina LaAM-08-1 TaxID=1095629 RepID=A0A0C9XQK5_9AGAR|nr:hypothetical protein K443DRAFT_676427 [Laccaria amethystina LaAM-08-1]
MGKGRWPFSTYMIHSPVVSFNIQAYEWPVDWAAKETLPTPTKSKPTSNQRLRSRTRRRTPSQLIRHRPRAGCDTVPYA